MADDESGICAATRRGAPMLLGPRRRDQLARAAARAARAAAATAATAATAAQAPLPDGEKRLTDSEEEGMPDASDDDDHDNPRGLLRVPYSPREDAAIIRWLKDQRGCKAREDVHELPAVPLCADRPAVFSGRVWSELSASVPRIKFSHRVAQNKMSLRDHVRHFAMTWVRDRRLGLCDLPGGISAAAERAEQCDTVARLRQLCVYYQRSTEHMYALPRGLWLRMSPNGVGRSAGIDVVGAPFIESRVMLSCFNGSPDYATITHEDGWTASFVDLRNGDSTRLQDAPFWRDVCRDSSTAGARRAIRQELWVSVEVIEPEAERERQETGQRAQT